MTIVGAVRKLFARHPLATLLLGVGTPLLLIAIATYHTRNGFTLRNNFIALKVPFIMAFFCAFIGIQRYSDLTWTNAEKLTLFQLGMWSFILLWFMGTMSEGIAHPRLSAAWLSVAFAPAILFPLLLSAAVLFGALWREWSINEKAP